MRLFTWWRNYTSLSRSSQLDPSQKQRIYIKQSSGYLSLKKHRPSAKLYQIKHANSIRAQLGCKSIYGNISKLIDIHVKLPNLFRVLWCCLHKSSIQKRPKWRYNLHLSKGIPVRWGKGLVFQNGPGVTGILMLRIYAIIFPPISA